MDFAGKSTEKEQSFSRARFQAELGNEFNNLASRYPEGIAASGATRSCVPVFIPKGLLRAAQGWPDEAASAKSRQPWVTKSPFFRQPCKGCRPAPIHTVPFLRTQKRAGRPKPTTAENPCEIGCPIGHFRPRRQTSVLFPDFCNPYRVEEERGGAHGYPG